MPFKLQNPNTWPCPGSQELAVIYPSSLLFLCLILSPSSADISVLRTCFHSNHSVHFDNSETVWAQRALSSSSLELPKCVGLGFFNFFFFCPADLQRCSLFSRRENEVERNMKQMLGGINGIRAHAFIQRAEVAFSVSKHVLWATGKTSADPSRPPTPFPCCITAGDLFKWWHLLKAEGDMGSQAPAEASHTSASFLLPSPGFLGSLN